MKKVLFLVFTILHLCGVPAQGRIMNYSESSWAVTLKLHSAWFGAGDSAYGLDLPETFKWQKAMDSAWGLEPGLFFHKGRVSFTVGYMYLTPMGQAEVSGATPGDASRSLTLDLRHNIFSPQAALEVDILQKSQSRLYAGAGAGMTTLKGTHRYSLSPALAADWGFSALEQKFESSAISKTLYTGWEYWLGQDTGLCFEIGYRDLFFRKLKYSQNTTLSDGPRSKGDELKRATGGDAGVNHGGAFAALNIKTYLRFF